MFAFFSQGCHQVEVKYLGSWRNWIKNIRRQCRQQGSLQQGIRQVRPGEFEGEAREHASEVAEQESVK